MSGKKARVVEVYSSKILSNGKIDSAKAVKMFEIGFDALSPTDVGSDLTEQLFPPKHTIGIKVNSLAGRRMSTSPEPVLALAGVLHKQGHKKSRVIIWDRKEVELKKAGYEIKTGGSDYRCFATDTPGVGFTRMLYKHRSIGSLVSKIQAEMCDSVINFPVLKDHSLAGLSGCLKNYFGVVHNPNKYHENLCDPFLADLYSMDIIKGKQKLAVFDAIRVQYESGPGFVSRWVCDYKAILMSTDAVALDAVAVNIIDTLRTKNGLKMLKNSGREPIGITTAGKDGLGYADLDDIEWIKTEV